MRAVAAFEAGCSDLVPAERWRQAVEDGRAFLARSALTHSIAGIENSTGHHDLPQAQQAGARPGRRQLGRFAMTHNHVSEARR